MNAPKSEIVCLYHANCTDGAAAAAVIKKKYPQGQFFPMNHGDEIKAKVEGKNVYIVDFSFDAEKLADLKKKAKEVFWYDHHKTALPTQQKLGWGIIDLAESGASLTWREEFPNETMPKIIEYVRDKDLYEWKLPNSREISMYLRYVEGITNPLSPAWKKMLEGISEAEWQEMIDSGARGLKHQKMTLQQGLKNSFPMNFHGHKTLALNWSLEASDMGELIYKQMGFDVALMFFYTGKEWNFSMRSEKVDVSEIALKYGGGGHPGAAGFRRPTVDWLFELRDKNSK